MRYLSNYKRFLNENKGEGLVNPQGIELNPQEQRSLGAKIMDWMDKNHNKVPNVLNSLMQWVSRNADTESNEVNPYEVYPKVWKDMRTSPDNDSLGNTFRNWVYFFGCTLTDNHPSYDALRQSLGKAEGRYQSKKTAHLRSSDPDNLKNQLSPYNPAHQVVKGVLSVRDKIRDSQDRKAAEKDERLKDEIMLLDDKGFQELIKVCQDIVAKSGVEKQVNTETNTGSQSEEKPTQVEEPIIEKPQQNTGVEN